MKRLIAVLFVMALVSTGCTTSGGLAVPGDSSKPIDWSVTSQYYKNFVLGFAIPVAGAIAVSAAPATAPLVSIAASEADKLGQLIDSKASGQSIQSQAAIVQSAIQTVNQAAGK